MNYVDRSERVAYEDDLVNKWSWLTEDITDYNTKLDTTMVLDNSYRQMVSEGSIPKGWLEAVINEDEEFLTEAPMRSGAVGSNLIPKVMFPIIRRVMPNLIANDLVSVQPLTQRNGVIYYITYKYSNTKGKMNAGTELTGNFSQDEITGGANFDMLYSSEKIGPFEVTVPVSGEVQISTGNKITDFLGTSASDFALKRIEVYNASTGAGLKTNLEGTGFVTGPTFTGGNAGYVASTGTILLKEAGADTGWQAGDNLVAYVVYDQEGTSKIPEVEFTIDSQTVDTTERKLKIRWTKEAEQDMNAYHKIDVESELVKIASTQMNYEIDRELLKFISDLVPTELTAVHTWTDDAGNNTQGNYLDRHRALSQKIYALSAKMAQYNRQGPANWVVVSPMVAAVLSMLPNFQGEISGNSFSIYQAGQLGNGIKVYIDPNKVGASASEILIGYKSNESTYGSGVVYSPYANWMSETIAHPENFNNIRGFFSRYAITKVPRGQWYYAKLTLTGVPGL